jgi:ketosteroid isomerase-like protein
MRNLNTNSALRTALFLLISAALLLPAAAQHKQKKTYKQVIAQLEAQYIKAVSTNDVATVERMLADDYIGISAQGMVATKQQTVDRIKNRQMVVSKLDVLDQKIYIHANTAIVTSEVEIDAVNNATTPPTPVHSQFRYTRVYLRFASGTWRIVNFESTHTGENNQTPAPTLPARP